MYTVPLLVHTNKYFKNVFVLGLQHSACRVLSSPSVGLFSDVLIVIFTGICKKERKKSRELMK